MFGLPLLVFFGALFLFRALRLRIASVSQDLSFEDTALSRFESRSNGHCITQFPDKLVLTSQTLFQPCKPLLYRYALLFWLVTQDAPQTQGLVGRNRRHVETVGFKFQHGLNLLAGDVARYGDFLYGGTEGGKYQHLGIAKHPCAA
jgi:hypothetical protein